VCVARLEALGRGVGNVFSINTVGNVIGAVLVGLLALPALGLERTLLVGGALSATLGVVLLWAWRPQGPDRWWRSLRDAVAPALTPGAGARLWPAALVLVAGVVAWRALGGPFWDPRVLQAGLYRWEVVTEVPHAWEAFRADRTRLTSLYSRDGADASLLVEQYPPQPNGRVARVIRVNGKPDAGNGADMPNQIFVGHLAAFFHPAPREAMVVGLGSGATAGALLRHEGLRLDVAEISPEMVEAAAHFSAVNDDALANPRLNLVVVDAREYLALGRRSYDVIVSEPTNVWVPGISTLFTRDFYQVVRSRLNPGGVFSQWLQAYSLDESMVASTLRSLREVFPYVSLWAVGDSDLVFLASDHRPVLDPADFNRRFAKVRPAEGLAASAPGLEMMADPITFLANQVATQEGTALYWPGTAVLPYRDLFPRMEFSAARMQFQGRGYRLLDELDERQLPLGRENLYLEDYLGAFPLQRAQVGRLAEWFLSLTPSIRRLGEALTLAELSVVEERREPARHVARLPTAEGLWLLTRELERSLHVQRSLAVCESYMTVASQALAAEASVFSQPSTASFEREVDACVAAHPGKAIEWRLRTVPRLGAAWAPERALARFRELEAEGAMSRLKPQAHAAIQLEAARLLLRLGQYGEARDRLQRSLAAQPLREAARLALGLAERPAD
jgi:spermidine synthase